ncbi:hypothetical protein BCR44DRAFT_87161 [Catenaria anguillulae PL171]|uniref:Uncharacterized protein n=1 Tax=Catenaria anguillulae PL171 TaxID=765915 RepID=A0A1Y2I4X8_9FUNG|nr:hypothetical protein BCR44DRAFT_87161 [Catenaria anguillulae PL171]
MQTAMTTTITLGSGPSMTTFVTVITPGIPLQPLTVTLGGGQSPVIFTQVPGATTFMTIVPTSGTAAHSSHESTWPHDIVLPLAMLVVALSLVTAALGAALMYLRSRVRDKAQIGPVAVELCDVAAASQVRQPQLEADCHVLPLYLVVEVPVPELDGRVSSESVGKSAGKERVE